MRLAAIDLGTNTVRLLVAEKAATGAWRPIEQQQRVTRLGAGLAASGVLQGPAMERTERAVIEYATLAGRLGATTIAIVATSAMRDATDGREFAARLHAATGHPVCIVSGEDEARLTLRGVLSGLPGQIGTVIVFDIGGGSTEVIRGQGGRVVAVTSLRLGVVALAEQPAPAARLRRLVGERLRRELSPTITAGGIDQLIGTAGTVTTLAALDLGLERYDAQRVHGHVLTREAIERQQRRLDGLSIGDIARLPCLEPGRADLIGPGLAITQAMMDVFAADSLVVSEYGLREGILAEACS